MTPGKLDIEVYAYATYRLPLQWSAGGSPVDMTGRSVRMQIRDRITSASPLITLDNQSAGGITVADPVAGQFVIAMTDEQTGALCIKSGVYDILVENPGGEVVRLLEGAVTVHPGVTRP